MMDILSRNDDFKFIKMKINSQRKIMHRCEERWMVGRCEKLWQRRNIDGRDEWPDKQKLINDTPKCLSRWTKTRTISVVSLFKRKVKSV